MKWILILTTWMEFVSPKTMQLPVDDAFECHRLETRIERMFETMPGDFGHMIECQPILKAAKSIDEKGQTP